MLASLPSSADVLHVWRLAIGDAPIADLTAILSPEERARASRFVFDRDRNQFIAVRGWLRRLLGGYLDRPPAEIRFDYGPEGKPLLPAHENNADLHFNVSHSANLGVLAFRTANDVGVDVELREHRFDLQDLARSCFSPVEQESMRAMSHEGQIERFFDLWTAKEAYIKALGGGLSIPLQEFSVGIMGTSDSWKVETTYNSPGPTLIRRLDVPDGYAGSVTTIGTEWHVEIFDIPSCM